MGPPRTAGNCQHDPLKEEIPDVKECALPQIPQGILKTCF